MTSPPPVLPSEENWILTRRRDQAPPAARHNFFFEAAATAAAVVATVGFFHSKRAFARANPCCGTPSIFNKMFCVVYMSYVTFPYTTTRCMVEERRGAERRLGKLWQISFCANFVTTSKKLEQVGLAQYR